MAGAHHRGEHPRLAKAVRDAAYANPYTTCWRCGERARPGDPWQAGHLVDGDTTSPLAAEHRSCNARAGAELVNGRRPVAHQRRQSQAW
jgi:hypothetical protein